MKKIYYAHSIHLYNTKQEQRDIELLEKLGFEVLNPNTRQNQIDYLEWLKSNDIKDSDKMSWFKNLVNQCNILAYRSHYDLRIPSGVLYELEYALSLNLPVFEIPTITDNRKMSVQETKDYLKYNGIR